MRMSLYMYSVDLIMHSAMYRYFHYACLFMQTLLTALVLSESAITIVKMYITVCMCAFKDTSSRIVLPKASHCAHTCIRVALLAFMCC